MTTVCGGHEVKTWKVAMATAAGTLLAWRASSAAPQVLAMVSEEADAAWLLAAPSSPLLLFPPLPSSFSSISSTVLATCRPCCSGAAAAAGCPADVENRRER